MKNYAISDRVSGKTHVQGVGLVPAKPAREVCIGERLVFNGGQTFTVSEYAKGVDKFIYLTLTNGERTVTIKRRPTTMLACLPKKA